MVEVSSTVILTGWHGSNGHAKAASDRAVFPTTSDGSSPVLGRG